VTRGSVIAEIFRLGSQEHWVGVGLAVENRAGGDGRPCQRMTGGHAGAICAAWWGSWAGGGQQGGRNAEPARALDDGAAAGSELGRNRVPSGPVVAHLTKLLIGVSLPLNFEGHSFLLRNG